MKADVININPEIMGGTPVFRGTRVPIETLFDHLESEITIDAFLDDYPTVSKEQVVRVLELVGQLFATKKIKQFYEIASCGSPPGREHSKAIETRHCRLS